MKVGALFAGYGGLDLGVRLAIPTAEVAWVCEVEPGPSAILAARYPTAPNYGDVTKVDWSSVAPVDVISGGSPCQDLSHAGKRKGMKGDTRSGLWASMCDAIEIIRPSLVIWENVRGALSAEATAGDVESCEFCVGDDGRPSLRALGRVLGDLAELGYDAAWCGLRAADVGAPHGRFRIFVLAWPADAEGDRLEAWRRGRRAGEEVAGPDRHIGALPVWGSPEWRDLTLLKTPTSQLAVNGGSQHPDKRKTGGHGPTLADEIEHLLPTPRATDGTKGGPNQRGSSGDLMLPSAVQLMPTPQAHDALDGKTAEQVAAMRERTGAGVWNLNEVAANELGASIDFGQYAPAIARWEALTRPAPAPTEPTGKGGAHRLSPRFVEWMMGLEDGWVTDPALSLSRNAALKALGNGVVPQQAATAIRRMAPFIGGTL